MPEFELLLGQTIEGAYLEMQPVVEATTVDPVKANPELATCYLTDYSVQQAESMVDEWRQLGERLLVKYYDGYIKNDKSRPQVEGYPETWLLNTLKERSDQFCVPVKKEAIPKSELVD